MNERELQLFRNRLLDLSRQCEDRNVPTHSYFLTVEEQRLAAQCLPNVAGIRMISDGVFCDAERKVLFFLPSYLEEPPEDELICLELAPRAPKFAEPLGHRDFLGALMGLGIRREMLGDLMVTENKAQLVALPSVKALIERELTEVRHTRIEVLEIPREALSAVRRTEVRSVNAASLRADVLVAAVWNLSRTRAKEAFSTGKVLRNGTELSNPVEVLRAGDVMSLRGKGKFRLCDAEPRSTRSGRLYVDIAYFV